MDDLNGLSEAELADREYKALVEMVSAHDEYDALFTRQGRPELDGSTPQELRIDPEEYVALRRRWYDAMKNLNKIRRRRRISELPLDPEH